VTETRTCYYCDRTGTPGQFIRMTNGHDRCKRGHAECELRRAELTKKEEELQ
jgi:hypothetical protein